MSGKPEPHGDFDGTNPGGSVDSSASTPPRSVDSSGDRAGLAFTDQAPAAPAATVVLEDAPPSEVWGELASAGGFQEALVDAVLDAARGRTYLDVHEALEEAGVDALHGSYRSLILRTARGDERALWDLLRETRGLGTGHSPFEDVIGAARLFGLALDHAPDRDVPTLEVRVTQAFREVRADQRRRICEVIATLARGCDVRLVATGLVTRWLAQEHREDLPGVSEACSTAPTRPGPVDELVEAARDALDVDGREVAILRALADEPAETLPYSALYAEHTVSQGRVRQCLNRLDEDLRLIDTFERAGGKHAELLTAGREFIDAVDREIGRQRRLDECVSETGNSCMKDRVTPGEHEGPLPEEATEDGTAGPYQVRYMDRANHAGAAASAVDGGVSLVDQPPAEGEDPRTHLVSYDDRRDEAVVSVRGSGAFPYVVSTAVALASPRFIDRVLPVSRLEQLDEPPAILRDARCVGWLSDEALEDGQVLRDALVEAGVELQDLTREFRHGEYEDADRFRGEIMRLAHGLAGTVAHLLEAFGVDLVREIRVPGGLDRERALEPMAKSVAISAAIQARYGAFATYRQLFESREEKRATALTPEVDAADPFGEVIGGFVLRGPDLHRLEPYLEEALRSPADVHEDAPEIAVPVRLVYADHRPAYADAVRRMCEAKNMDATREAVSLLQAFTGSPYDAARALRGLGSEDLRREIHPDEVRLALSTLPADRVLPGGPPTVSKAVHALLTAEGPLTQTELAERAGISPRSVRNHAERLEAFALIEETADGYRLALPFREERYADLEDVLPWYAVPNRERDDYRDATEKGVLAEVYDNYHFEGTDAVLDLTLEFVTLEIPPDVRREIVDVWPWAEPLLEFARVLSADEPARETAETVTLGAEIEQAPLTEAGSSPITPATAPATEGSSLGGDRRGPR